MISEAVSNISSVHGISSTQPKPVPTKISLDKLPSGGSLNNVQKSPPSSITSVPDDTQLPHGCLRSFEKCYFKSYFPWSAFNWNKSQSYQHFLSNVKKEDQRTEQKSSQEFVCMTRDNARGKSKSLKELQVFVPQVRPTDWQRHLSLLAVTQVRKSNCNVSKCSVSNFNIAEAPLLNFSSLISSPSNSRKTNYRNAASLKPSDQTHSHEPINRTYKLPVPQEIACESFGNTSSLYANDSFSTNNHIESEIGELSSSSNQSTEINSDVFITSEDSQAQKAFRQPLTARSVFVTDTDYTLHTIDSYTESGHASQPEPHSDRSLPQPICIGNLPSVNLTDLFTSQQPVTLEETSIISSLHAESFAQPQPVPTKISLNELPPVGNWKNGQKSPPSSITSVPDVPQLPFGCFRSFEKCYFKSYFPWSAFNWNKSQSYQHFPSDVKKEGQGTEHKSSQEFVCMTRDNVRGKSNSPKELQGFVPQVRPTDSQRHLSLLAVTQVRKKSNCNVPLY